METKKELILLRITGEDRPGLTASFMEILARYDADVMDIGQADIHNTLSLGIMIYHTFLHLCLYATFVLSDVECHLAQPVCYEFAKRHR